MRELFVEQAHRLDSLREISFHKYTWRDVNVDNAAAFLSATRSIERVEILTVNDCHRSISSVLEALVQCEPLREFRMPINAIREQAIEVPRLLL